jgi:hypothetical protein
MAQCGMGSYICSGTEIEGFYKASWWQRLLTTASDERSGKPAHSRRLASSHGVEPRAAWNLRTKRVPYL